MFQALNYLLFSSSLSLAVEKEENDEVEDEAPKDEAKIQVEWFDEFQPSSGLAINWDVAARGGMETLRPALQRAAYRDALKCFIEGYQEGIQQVMEKKEGTKSQEEKDVHKGPS